MIKKRTRTRRPFPLSALLAILQIRIRFPGPGFMPGGPRWGDQLRAPKCYLKKKKKKLSGMSGGREDGLLKFLTSIPGVLGRKPPHLFSKVRMGESGRPSWSKVGRSRDGAAGAGGGRGRTETGEEWTASRGGATSGRAEGRLARVQAAAKAAALSQWPLGSVLVLCFHLVLSGAE